jgi:hypothetical protein
MWIRLFSVLCIFFVLTGVGSARAGEPELTPRSVLNDTVVILVPKEFELMSEDMARLKYPSENRPRIVFTNYDGTVNVTVKPTDQRMTQDAILVTVISLQAALKSSYPSQTVRSGLAEVGGREVFLVDMHTPALDTEIRNLIAGASVQDRLVMFSFNVTRELEAEWVDVGKHILTSIKFTD